MLSENMVPWYIKYFRIKEFEKMTEAGKVITSHVRHALLIRVERHILHSGPRGTQKNPKKQSLLSFPQLTSVISYSDSPIFLHKCSHFIRLTQNTEYYQKSSGIIVSSGLHFLINISHKMYV